MPDRELIHYGVKGMKWGVTRAERRAARKAAREAPTSVEVTQKRPGSKVTATGGKNQPASPDAKRAAALYQKSRASTTDSLSNDELKDLVKRMNLESQYANLSVNRKSAGERFVADLFGEAGKRQARALVNDQADAYGKQVRDRLRPAA